PGRPDRGRRAWSATRQSAHELGAQPVSDAGGRGADRGGAMSEVAAPAVPDREALMRTLRTMIEQLGLDADSDGLHDTPRRIVDMYLEVFEGVHQDPREVLQVQFSEGHQEMVILRDIPFYSMCEHHFMPFHGE